MAENINALILPIGADPTQFQKSINDVKNNIKELSSTIAATPFNLVSAEQKANLAQLQKTLKTLITNLKEFGSAVDVPANSIAGLDKRIKELNAQKITLDAKTSASEIARLTKEIEKLTEQRNNINKLGSSINNLPSSLDRFSKSSKEARTSVTSLNLILQDLPFGFIAIQNNLPAIFQSFNRLKEESKGVGGALKAIGSQLVGPAGIFLAFTAITSAVTVLTQKYGSLSIALDALLGKQTTLSTEVLNASESLKKFNEEFKTSNQLIRESNAGTEGQITRVKTLSKIVLDQTKSYDERNAALKDLKKLDENYFFALDIEKTSYKNLSAAVNNYNKSLKENASARSLEDSINKTNVELSDQEEILKKLNLELDRVKRGPIKIVGAAATRQDTEEIKAAESAVNAQNAVLDALKLKLQDAKVALDAAIQSENKLKAPVLATNEALKKQQELLEKLEKERLKGDKVGTTYEGEQLNNGVITSDIGLLVRTIEANVRLTNAAVDKMRRYREKNTPSAPDFLPKKLDKKTAVPMSQELEQQVGATKLELDKLATKFMQTNEALQNTFFQPLSSAFENFFETGKFGFKEFGKAIVNTIKQIVARIIATGIINLLASILVPGGAQAASLVGGAAGAGSGIGRAFGDAFRSVLGLGGNRVAAPSFGGVGGGGMQMSGQVVFVQRGSDLVGVLNRTNGTINRVG